MNLYIFIIIGKFIYPGIRGNILKLIKLYLSDRTQIISVNNEFRNLNNILTDVKPGSILKLLWFNTHINSLLNI